MVNQKLHWKGYGRSDVGCVREGNDDSYFTDNRSGIYLVADGMGGIKGGAVASRIITNEIPGLLRHIYQSRKGLDDTGFQAKFQEIVHSVNDLILRHGKESDLPGMGSTMNAVFIKNNTALVANVGDSRCYLLRDKSLTQISVDHSCPTHPNQLTKVMGDEQNTVADLFVVPLDRNDLLLLCSDGLNHMVSDTIILNTLIETPFNKICSNLISKAKHAGGEDNITVIAIAAKESSYF